MWRKASQLKTRKDSQQVMSLSILSKLHLVISTTVGNEMAVKLNVDLHILIQPNITVLGRSS